MTPAECTKLRELLAHARMPLRRGIGNDSQLTFDKDGRLVCEAAPIDGSIIVAAVNALPSLLDALTAVTERADRAEAKLAVFVADEKAKYAKASAVFGVVPPSERVSLPTAEAIVNEVAHLEEKYAINRAVAARGEAAMQSSVEAYKIQNLEKEILRLKVGWRDAAHIAEARIQELGQLKLTTENERDAYRKRKDEAYEERNRLVAVFASIAVMLGWPAGMGQHVDVEGEDWDPEWKTLVVVQTPEGQASWHFHDSQRYLVDHLPEYAPKWDGHNTKTKYERLMRLAVEKAMVQV